MYNNKIGVIFPLQRLLDEGAGALFDLGVECVQLVTSNHSLLTEENAKRALELMEGKVQITSFWCGWTGPAVWDSVDGPHTLGLVPVAYRFQRMQEVMKGADFAYWLGARNLATHVGFIPEQPTYEEYRGVVQAVRRIVSYCADKDLCFNFETGQETPITLMRIITDIGLENVGINLDPANLIMYGRGNPVDAVDIFGDRIKGVHIKDADYTKDYYKLGKERVVGEGSVNFPVFLPKLLKQGYTGDLYIEREIKGEQQAIDIKKTIKYLKELMG